jgi:hypothetical protein
MFVERNGDMMKTLAFAALAAMLSTTAVEAADSAHRARGSAR